MSYCRKNNTDSDLYIFNTLNKSGIEVFECMCCDLIKEEEEQSFLATTRSDMVLHMFKHQKVGHRVLERAIRRLLEEISTHGDTEPV